jgi:hypothetical protein
MFFTFREDARWNDERQAVEFGVGIGEYGGLSGSGGVCSRGFCRRAQPRSGVSKPTTSNARALNGLPSASCVGGS